MPDSEGNISLTDMAEAINKDTILVSMMCINNESGAVFPVDKIKRLVTRADSPALIHIDCVQAFGKVDVRPKKLGADLVTITAHKIHGPKGVGALYIRKGARILSRTLWRRAGKENSSGY